MFLRALRKWISKRTGQTAEATESDLGTGTGYKSSGRSKSRELASDTKLPSEKVRQKQQQAFAQDMHTEYMEYMKLKDSRHKVKDQRTKSTSPPLRFSKGAKHSIASPISTGKKQILVSCAVRMAFGTVQAFQVELDDVILFSEKRPAFPWSLETISCFSVCRFVSMKEAQKILHIKYHHCKYYSVQYMRQGAKLQNRFPQLHIPCERRTLYIFRWGPHVPQQSKYFKKQGNLPVPHVDKFSPGYRCCNVCYVPTSSSVTVLFWRTVHGVWNKGDQKQMILTAVP